MGIASYLERSEKKSEGKRAEERERVRVREKRKREKQSNNILKEHVRIERVSAKLAVRGASKLSKQPFTPKKMEGSKFTGRRVTAGLTAYIASKAKETAVNKNIAKPMSLLIQSNRKLGSLRCGKFEQEGVHNNIINVFGKSHFLPTNGVFEFVFGACRSLHMFPPVEKVFKHGENWCEYRFTHVQNTHIRRRTHRQVIKHREMMNMHRHVGRPCQLVT